MIETPRGEPPRLTRNELEGIARGGTAETALTVLQHGTIEGEGHPYRRETGIPADIQLKLAARVKKQEIKSVVLCHAASAVATIPVIVATMVATMLDATMRDKTAEPMLFTAFMAYGWELSIYTIIRRFSNANVRKRYRERLLKSGTLKSAEAATVLSSIKSLRDRYLDMISRIGEALFGYRDRNAVQPSSQMAPAKPGCLDERAGPATSSARVRVAIPAQPERSGKDLDSAAQENTEVVAITTGTEAQAACRGRA